MSILKEKCNIIFFIIFIIIIIFIGIHHENWRDEAQAYLLCRDMNIIDLLKNIPYEGHPFLYYILLFPLVKLGVGFKSVNILSFIFISISVYLILFKSKLNNIQKISIILSYPIMYEFSIIGRSYSLCFLLLTIYGLLYSKKEKYSIYFSIVLGLLLNTHLFMLGFVGINVLVFYVYEIFKNKRKTDKNIIIGFCIILFFALLLFIQFCPMLFSKTFMSLSKNNISDSIIIFFLMLFGGIGLKNIIIVLLSIIVLIFIYIYIFKRDKLRFLILIISYLYMSCLINYIFPGVSIFYLYFAFSFLFIVILSMGDKINSDKRITIYLIIISFLSFFNIVSTYVFDYNNDYSSAYKTSKYISKNISSNSIFICNDDALCSSIIPYVNNKFYSTKTNKYFTYVVWNKEREGKVNYSKLEKYINNNNSLYYIVSNYNYKKDMQVLKTIKKKYKVKKIFVSDNKKTDSIETYIVYKIK